MTEEELNNNTTPEPTSGGNTDTPEPTPSVGIRYCTISDVEVLIDVNIPDDAHDTIIGQAIDNATGRIHAKLRANRVPLPDPEHVSSTIKTVAIYFAICDLYSSLFNGTDWEIESNHWCKTGSELLEDYILAYENTCAEDLEKYALSGHKNSMTYKERKKHGHRSRRYY